MPPTPQRLTIAQGEAIEIRIVVVNDATGAPQSLTGAALSFVVAASVGQTAIVTKTTGGNGVTLATTDAANDTAVVTLAPSDTAALVGEYGWELAITGTQAGVVALGALTITPSTIL